MNEEMSPADLWCPIEENRKVQPGHVEVDMTPDDWTALSRFNTGEWVSDQLIDRLESLGLIEKVFGQPLLTRLGRVTIGDTA